MVRKSYQLSRVASICLIVPLLVFMACESETKMPDRAARADHRIATPNVIILYVDDLGYADVGSYGAVGVETPEIDQLARRGVKFTDAHSSAATCTPSRYSLLTGRHGFRNDAAILPGDAPLLIPPESPTLPSIFKRAGYQTAVVGKWHLGLGSGGVDWNQMVAPGPLEIGFDYSFLLPATGDRVPTVYLENHGVVNLDPNDPITVSYKKKVGDRPTGVDHPEMLRVKADRQHSDSIVNGVSRIGYMAGGTSAEWVDEDFPDVFTSKAVQFINDSKDSPFFLFYSFHDVHVPRLPHPRFQGTSSMGPRGDAIAQVDWVTGEIVRELDALGLTDDTIIIFTSDNGPVLDDGYADDAVAALGSHKPAGPFRGGKYSAFEAGTRVPTILLWPGVVSPSVSDALVSQMDFYASFARLLDIKLAQDEAQDSIDILDALLGSTSTGRDFLVEESVGTLSLRNGQWKYIAPIPEDAELPDWLPNKQIEGGFSRRAQLYDLSTDKGEQIDIAESNDETTRLLADKLADIVSNGY